MVFLKWLAGLALEVFWGKLVELLSALVEKLSVYVAKKRNEQISKELGEALDKAVNEKDQRDLERIFDPSRKYPPADGGN